MSPLDRKLIRDLWRVKGQAMAIGTVIATGVLLLVMMTGLVTTLDETRRAYYERYRLAEIFAPVTRAPRHRIADLAAIPSVLAAEGRVTGSALIDLDGVDLPVRAQAISLPDFGMPRLNDIFLSEGRRPSGGHADEIVLLKSFADANSLRPGDRISATMNGIRRELRIVGLAQSPEFLYTAAPGEFISDDKSFGIIWMNRSALAAAFDMKGAFNEALLALRRGAGERGVREAADRILEPFGGRGAFALADLFSNRFITEEISGMRASSVSVPPIFLAVAAFLLYIVISRMVHAERAQIGLMKAFGYSNLEVGAHYFKLVMVIAVGGALAGCVLGIAAGRAMVGFYLAFFKFPFLVFTLDPGAFVTGILISVASASAGGLFVLRGVFALTPATAMRPPAPQDFSRTGQFGKSLNALLDQPSRMVLRRLTRQPGRMIGAAVGISAGMALAAAMSSIIASYDYMTDLSFSIVDRSDMTVTFIHPLSDKTIYELRRIPGVVEVEPERSVAAILRNGLKTYRGAVTGLVSSPRLKRPVSQDLEQIFMREDGLVLATGLANVLAVSAGDLLTVEVREGRRPTLTIPVVAIAESLLGSPSYMEMGALNRALHEPGRVSGARLRIDTARADRIYRKLKSMPTIAGVSLKSDARRAFKELTDTGAGAMRFVMAAIAAIITFGVVYNAARIAQAERARDLSSLRVMGFTSGEVSFVLLGELAVVALVALPVGAILGYYLTFAISAGFSTDLYQVPTVFNPASYGIAALAVIGSALISGWLVKRDIDRADLISALKTQE